MTPSSSRFRKALPGFSRRGFLGSSMTAGAGAAAWLGGYRPKPVGAEEPRQGGTLRIAFADTPETLDAQASFSFPGQQFSAFIYDNLTFLRPDGQPEPGLAVRWESNPDATEWVFDLREGVEFHHGRAFTSADVIATIERAIDPALGLNARDTFGAVESVIDEGPHRIRLKLQRPFAELPVNLGNRWGRILPADLLETAATEPVGTGPFVFKDFQPGSNISASRFERYWADGRPYLDEVRIVAIRESMAAQAALLGGAVDLITMVPAEAYLTLRNAPGVVAYSETTGNHHSILTQANLPPFDNVLVRRAFKYILDRKPLITSALFGQGSVGNDVPLPPGAFYLPDDLPTHDQDLAKARQLLDEAGVGELTLDFWCTSDRPPTPKLAVAFAEAAARIGVRINVRDVPYTEFAAQASRKVPLHTSHSSGAPTLYESIHRIYRTGSPFNYSGHGTPELDALIDSMVAETDIERRKDLVRQVLTITQEDGERIYPYFQNYIGATTEAVRGFVPPQWGSIEIRSIWLDA